MLEFVLLAGFAVFAVYITVRSNAGEQEVANPTKPLEVKLPVASVTDKPHYGITLDSNQPAYPSLLQ